MKPKLWAMPAQVRNLTISKRRKHSHTQGNALQTGRAESRQKQSRCCQLSGGGVAVLAALVPVTPDISGRIPTSV